MKIWLTSLFVLLFSSTVWADTIIFAEAVKYSITIEEPEQDHVLVLSENGDLLLAAKITLDYRYTIKNIGDHRVAVDEIVEIDLVGPTATSLTRRISGISAAPPGSVVPRNITALITLDNIDGIRLTKPGSYSLRATFKVMAESEKVFSSAASAKIKFDVKRASEETSLLSPI
jgi:hypothetical protein